MSTENNANANKHEGTSGIVSTSEVMANVRALRQQANASTLSGASAPVEVHGDAGPGFVRGAGNN